MRGWRAGIALAAMIGSAAMAADVNQPASGTARAFGAREDIHDVSISPDGTKVAFIRSNGARGQVLTIYAVDGSAQKSILTGSGDLDNLTSCAWSTSTRLVCNIHMLGADSSRALRYRRMIAIDSDGGNMRLLSARTGVDAIGIDQIGGSVIDWTGGDDGKDDGGEVLMTRMIVPERSTGTRLAEQRSGLAVERVNTLTLKRTVIEQPRASAGEFITDGHGVVRIWGVQSANAAGYNYNRIDYFYRRPDSREWQPLSTVALNAGRPTGLEPLAVDPALNIAYGFDEKDGHRALYRIALDGSLKRELVYANPAVDVDGLIAIGRQSRVVGASYVTEKRETLFFDPELNALRTALAKALPAGSMLSFVDASADEKRLVLYVGSDIDPGRYYLYDKTKRQLSELLSVRPQLAKTTLAPVRPVSYLASDGTRIPGYLTLPPGSNGKGLPAIVMPHGGPGARDEWGFDWLAQFYANRGYAVLQPNFRGSAGYGDAWFQKNGFQSWQTAVGDVNAGGRWLLSEGIATPGKLAVIGWSYGGYAALQSAVLDPDLFKAIVAIAPVTDLETLRNEARDYTHFPQTDALIGHGPHVRAGSPAQNAGAIRAPVLLFHGERDIQVGVGQSRLMASRLRSAGKKVDYVEFSKLDHQLPDDAVRAQMLDRSDAFLKTALGN